MANKRQMPVVQLGGQPVLSADSLDDAFQWVYRPDHADDPTSPKLTLTANGQITPAWRNALFLLPSDDPTWGDFATLSALPANHILYDQQVTLDADLQDLFALKGAFPADLTDTANLAALINRDWFPGQDAFKLDHGSLRVLGSFDGDVTRFGRYHLRLSGNFGPDLQPVAIWETQGYAPRNCDLTFQAECQASPDLTVRYQLTLINQQSARPIRTVTFDPAEYPLGKTLHMDETDFYYTLSVLVKGQGQLDIGLVHVAKARERFGQLFPGGHLAHVPDSFNDNFYYYFDAGDMRPPLNVYFSGFNMADHFEGNFMMESFGAPFLLISDPRLNGGGFYIGSEAFETNLLHVIQATLHRLGFADDELILSGISEGTTAAMYYGAQLAPRAIVAGKPLINLGTTATNGRIKRTQDFQPSFDLLLSHTGDVTPETAQALNDRIWKVIHQGDFSQTTFAIAHMYQDDFDNTSFSQLFDWVTTSFPHVRFLHKGIQGRHNDNTPAINAWFIKQYRMILASEFQRHFTEEGVAQ
ncbi:accessory Sec system protein Asp2 [Levilactobacillus namurensis]|uniref:accessory Sec system protein Asp2 n=1 Tax=Levilactobacillus namurensis TaxID=380393 RepID=UPI0028BCB7D6|nr:accessory Sec system protein Asp2 [Levilactobacillus namurensis]MDT7019688.1 accessory Sec system protein Asp2 [Levilactobacillus namurensis]WNN65723.1 accessory Sec system protein Asp2 [Levilactobacillus namurensis]